MLNHSAAIDRATRVSSRHLGWAGGVIPVQLGESNDVWFAGPAALKMAKTPGRSNLLVEARVVAALPATVGYPEVLGSGVEEDHEWMATARLAGDNLGACWPRLDAAERERAVIDLCLRVDAIGSTPLDGLPNLDPSPFYRLDRLQAATDLDQIGAGLDTVTIRALHAILDEGLVAMTGTPYVLAHSDAGPGNAVWDGRQAIPVDFEFATLAPEDLDIENLARSITTLSPTFLPVVARSMVHRLHTPGAAERIRAYAVLRDTWALRGWIANWPERRNIHDWEPTRRLRSIADGTSWVTTLLSG
jgi:hypothetical protein